MAVGVVILLIIIIVIVTIESVGELYYIGLMPFVFKAFLISMHHF